MSIIKNGVELFRALISDGATDVGVDIASKGLKTITVPHSRIHGGVSYFHDSFIDLGAGASRQFILAVPDTATRIHFLSQTDFESESSVTFTEGVSTDADGTAITEFNRDRNSSNTAEMVLTHTPTNPAGGTVLSNSRKGSGKQTGGTQRGVFELILKQNTKYLINITNHAATASLTSWLFGWYEVT